MGRGKSKVEEFVTIRLHYGGTLLHMPTAKYIGGHISTHRVPFNSLNIRCLDAIGELQGYSWKKFYHILEDEKFTLLLLDRQLKDVAENFRGPRARQLHVYVEAYIPTDLQWEGLIIDGRADEGDVEEVRGGGEGEIRDEHAEEDDEFTVEGDDEGMDALVGESMNEQIGVGEEFVDEGEDDSSYELEEIDNIEEDNFFGSVNDQEGKGKGMVEGDVMVREEGKGIGKGKKVLAYEEDVGALRTDEGCNIHELDLCKLGEDFDSVSGSDGEKDTCHLFSSSTVFNPTLELGMRFESKKDFKKAIKSLGVMTKRELKISKNDKRRMYAICTGKRKDTRCNWHAHLLFKSDEKSWQVREYNSTHICRRLFKVNNLSSSWMAEKYEDTFRMDPKKSIKGFRAEVRKDLNLTVNRGKVYRAKQLALKKIEGNSEAQYQSLWDYAEELRRSNPGSTVIMQLVEGNVDAPRKFGKFYVCLAALKRGFLAGCRPLIGVDGCHLKGPHKGILLTAIAIDPNNSFYPVAYAVVGSEDGEAWEWFLRLLKDDLDIVNDNKFTLVSDKQKGLIKAAQSVLPDAHHRFCVRHLHGNFKRQGYTGLALKLALFGAAKASTVCEWEIRMEEIGKLNEKAKDWLSKMPAHQWSRSHFDTFPKSDMLLNNLCETFNHCILEAREKGILTMLEWIRLYLMTRLQECRDMVNTSKKWIDKKICPKIGDILDENASAMKDCIPHKSDDLHYEIECYDGATYTVDLHNWSCSCRMWDLTGIPCKHALTAITAQDLDMDDFVDKCYHVETYRNVYEPAILPVNGPALWEKTGIIPPLPPNFGRRAGRPAKARRLEVDEPRRRVKKKYRGRSAVSMGKMPYKVTCSQCGDKGHNKLGCGKASSAMDQQATRIVGESTAGSGTVGEPSTNIQAMKGNCASRNKSQESLNMEMDATTENPNFFHGTVIEQSVERVDVGTIQVSGQPNSMKLTSKRKRVAHDEHQQTMTNEPMQQPTSSQVNNVTVLKKGNKSYVVMPHLAAAVRMKKSTTKKN